MIKIIFKREKKIWEHYYTLSETKKKMNVGRYCTFSKGEEKYLQQVLNYFKDSTEFDVFYDGRYTVEIRTKEDLYHKVFNNYYTLKNKEIIKFEIDAPPYTVGENIYLNSTNYYYYLTSRVRDDQGNWIYEVDLSHGQNDSYSENEIFEFDEFKRKQEDGFELYKIDIEKIEKYKSEVEDVINSIVKKEDSNNGISKPVIEVEQNWFKRFLNRF